MEASDSSTLIACVAASLQYNGGNCKSYYQLLARAFKKPQNLYSILEGNPSSQLPSSIWVLPQLNGWSQTLAASEAFCRNCAFSVSQT